MQIFHSSSSFVVYFSGVPSFPIVYETIIENDVDTYRKGTLLMEEDSRLVTILQQYHTRLYIINIISSSEDALRDGMDGAADNHPGKTTIICEDVEVTG